VRTVADTLNGQQLAALVATASTDPKGKGKRADKTGAADTTAAP
jgi:hypothetical protein